jgi:hypothetical protein
MSTVARLALLAALLPISAAAQSSEAPGFLQEIKLTARLHAGGQRIAQTIRPIEREQLQFLGQPVHPTVHYRSPQYGVSAGLRFRGAGLFGMLSTNGGFYPDIPFTGAGGQAIFFGEPVAWTMSARGEYFLTDYLGVGIKIEERDETLDQRRPTLPDKSIRVGILSGRRHYRALSVYIPLQFDINEQLSVDGHAGVGLVANGRERYHLSFARVEKVTYEYGWGLDYDREYEGSTSFEAETHVSLQFGEVGLTYSGLGLPLRLAAHVRRLSVPRMSQIWKTGLDLRLGLPF